MLFSAALALLVVAGASADPPPTKEKKSLAPKTQQKDPIAAAWLAMPEVGSACADADLSFDYGVQGGMRNFFCRALTVTSWKSFVALAPVKPFRKGPHKGTRLELQAERDFGRYDPAFVKWATTALVPAASNAELRAQTQPLYDRQVKELARVYFLVDKALSSSPKWIENERRRYLVSMDAKGGGWDVWEITGSYHDVLGTADENWGGHDPNHVRSAVMWWLRRHHDETASLWREGLVRLLETYDPQWLRDEKASTWNKALPAPPSEKKTPEYQE